MFGTIAPAVLSIIDKVIPDKEAAEKAKLELIRMEQEGKLELLKLEMSRELAQTEVNKAESQTDLFRGGWRPFVGWVCGFGLALQFIIAPIFSWVASLAGYNQSFPELDISTLLTLLFGMLGLGYMRTTEKINRGNK